MLTADEANDRYGKIGLKWTEPVPVAEAEVLAERRRREIAADSVYRSARNAAGATEGLNAAQWVISGVAELMASAADPYNIAIGMIPFAGGAMGMGTALARGSASRPRPRARCRSARRR